MDEIGFDYIVLIVIAVIVLFAIYRYRGKFALTLKAWGIDLGFQGENPAPEKSADAPAGAAQAGGNTAEASGDGAVAIGGNANGATITTSSGKPGPKPQ